jgi:hypothetical protein
MWHLIYKPTAGAYSSLHDNGWGKCYGQAKTIRPP